MRLKQLQMDDDDEDLIPTNRKNVARPPIWQYYDAMDFLYTIARQQLLNERRQHEKKVSEARAMATNTNQYIYTSTICSNFRKNISHFITGGSK